MVRAPAIWVGDVWRRDPGVVRLLAVERSPVPEVLTSLGARCDDREWTVPVERAGALRHLAAEIETRWLGGSWEQVGLPADVYGGLHLAPLDRRRPTDPAAVVGPIAWPALCAEAARLTDGACWTCGLVAMWQLDVDGMERVEHRPVPVVDADDGSVHAEQRCVLCDEVERSVVDADVDLPDAARWLAMVRHLPVDDVRAALEWARRAR